LFHGAREFCSNFIWIESYGKIYHGALGL
jgi:hypothetical protein